MNESKPAEKPQPGAVDPKSGLRQGGVSTIDGGDQDPPDRQAEKARRRAEAEKAAKPGKAPKA